MEDMGDYNILCDKIQVIVTKWAFPFGGGEEFLYQTMEWAYRVGIKSYWLCFTDSNNKNFEELLVEQHEYGIIIKIPDGFTEDKLLLWLKLLKPDIVQHQGHLRMNFYAPCEKLRIEFMSGFHFWSGGIVLNPIYKNIDIIDHRH